MNFSDRLKTARKAAGLTQQELADRIGVTKSGISGVETSVSRVMRGDNLVKTCRVLGVREAWLSNGHGEMRDTMKLPTEDLSIKEARLAKIMAEVDRAAFYSGHNLTLEQKAFIVARLYGSEEKASPERVIELVNRTDI